MSKHCSARRQVVSAGRSTCCAQNVGFVCTPLLALQTVSARINTCGQTVAMQQSSVGLCDLD
jgi:hypothetical protein